MYLHAASMGDMRNECEILIRKSEEIGGEIIFKKREGVGFIKLAQNKVK